MLQLGVCVSRILNGAKPAELPVIQPTKFAEDAVHVRRSRPPLIVRPFAS
jgi:hypothetical protein